MAFVEEHVAAYTVEGFNNSLFSKLPINSTFEKAGVQRIMPDLPIPFGGECGQINFSLPSQFNRIMYDVANVKFIVRKYCKSRFSLHNNSTFSFRTDFER